MAASLLFYTVVIYPPCKIGVMSPHGHALHSLASYGKLCRLMAKIAIIETGGKQYLVTQDSVLRVEKISNSGKSGDKITFEKVLLTDDGKQTVVGTPYVSGATVSAELIEEGRHQKVTAIRYKQKSRYFKKKGHRQPYTKIRITDLP